MKPLLGSSIATAIAALIMFIGIAAWSYLMTGDWPPQYLLIGASIGGMVSPHLWAYFHRLSDRKRG